VFSIIFKAKWGIDTGDNRATFSIIMFCGMAVYNIFAESLNSSCQLILDNQNYVKKVIFPLEILPWANTLSVTILGMVWFILLLIGTLILFQKVFWTIVFLPLTLIPVILFSCAGSYICSSLSVYIRDTRHFVGLITQILFFMTPIFYPLQAVPEKYRFLLQINPLTQLVIQTRQLFIYGKIPDLKICGIIFIISLIVFLISQVWFLKTKKGFADVL
jgi:lipopolysaccharide transport system permease protein